MGGDYKSVKIKVDKRTNKRKEGRKKMIKIKGV